LPNPPKIERLYAWIVTEPDGSEGVAGALSPGSNTFHPLVGADRKRIESHREHARAIHRATGFPVRLVCFEHLLEIEKLG
jgi:hypothetical protein